MRKGRKLVNAKRVTIDGIKLDSRKEGRRYNELKLLEQQGYIKNLRVHPPYELKGGEFTMRTPTGRMMKYKPDFTYNETSDDEFVVEDVKPQKRDGSFYVTDAAKYKIAVFECFYGVKVRLI